jgi:hypothetical protein
MEGMTMAVTIREHIIEGDRVTRCPVCEVPLGHGDETWEVDFHGHVDDIVYCSLRCVSVHLDRQRD